MKSSLGCEAMIWEVQKKSSSQLTKSLLVELEGVIPLIPEAAFGHNPQPASSASQRHKQIHYNSLLLSFSFLRLTRWPVYIIKFLDM